MGHVVAMDDSPAQLALTVYSRAVWLEQAALFPASVEYQSPGTLWVAVDDEELAEVHARHRTYRAYGVPADILTPAQLSALEPNLRAGLAGALFVTGDGICHPPSAAAFYLADAQSRGAQLFPARAVSAASGLVTLADGTLLASGKIILATGTDCDLLPRLPIRKRKGQLILTQPAPGFLHRQIVELGYLKSARQVESDSIAFNVQPRPDGQICIGASRQYGNEDPAPDAHILAQLRARAAAYMPALATLETASIRVGFRAATPDKLPLLGPTQDATVFLAAGFEGLGITSAPGAARLLADILLNRVPAIDPTPYHPSRLLL
jgi:glycine/D-amino acid oxidase-like deaminating enzyme